MTLLETWRRYSQKNHDQVTQYLLRVNQLKQNNEQPGGRDDEPPRILRTSDITGFMEAAEARPPSGIKSARKMLIKQHPYRMASIDSEYRWLQKQMTEMHMNPEDARWLL